MKLESSSQLYLYLLAHAVFTVNHLLKYFILVVVCLFILFLASISHDIQGFTITIQYYIVANQLHLMNICSRDLQALYTQRVGSF